MAVFPPPVELPTNRQSRFFDQPIPNIHDPNYIPILNGATVKVDFSKPKFDSFPSVPTPAKERPDVQLSRSKSSLAPERVPQDYATETNKKKFSPRNASLAQGQGASASRPTSDDENYTSASEDNTTSSGVPSTQSMQSLQGAMNLLEDQIFAIPGNVVPKPEDIALPTISTARSSTRKSIPTSRYNKKATLPSVPTLPSGIGNRADTPQGSTRTSPDLTQSYDQGDARPKSSGKAPTPPPFISAEPLSIQSTPKLGPMKSTMSDRRQRALHSHPYSSPSLRSKPESLNEDVEDQALIERPATTVRRRSDSIAKSQQSPAPSTPLPDLPSPAPVQLKSPNLSIRANRSPLIGVSTVQSPATREEHTEMAEFMTTNKKVIFRRFDDVHVRLLLHLQDDISALEKELLEVEAGGSARPDKTERRTNIMLELRKVLAEYDHLFANWSHMKSSQASPHDKEQLAKWLKNPTTPSGNVTKSAQDDVEWVQTAKDLSTVSLIPHRQSLSTNEKPRKATTQGWMQGFTSLFNCAGKRK